MWLSARFQAQPERYPAPWISQTQRSPQDRNQPRPLAQLTPCRSPHRSKSASTIRPAPHNAPLSLSIVVRSQEADLIHSWRADSLAFVWLDPGITPCCKTRRMVPLHPDVERVMQKEIRQDRAYHPTL